MNDLLFRINDCFGDLDAPADYKWDKAINDRYSIYDFKNDPYLAERLP